MIFGLGMPWDAEGCLEECPPITLPTSPGFPIASRPPEEEITPSMQPIIEWEAISFTEEPNLVPTITPPSGTRNPSPGPSPSLTPNPTPMQIAPPIPGKTTVNVPGIAPVANNRPHPSPNLPRPSGVNGPSRDVGDTVQPSAPVEGNTPQNLNDEGDKPGDGLILTLVSVGASTTLTVITEVPLGTGPTRSNTRTSTTSEMQPYVGPAMTPNHGQNNTPTQSGLPPAAVGAIVGSLLGALILWVLLVIWLKKRKKSRGFKELEEATSSNPSVERNGITPFVAPSPELRNPINPDSKRRFMQEVPRPISPVTSIGDSIVHSEFYTMPITESLSEDPYSVASSSDPFKRLSASHKDPQEIH
ncbi:hypothetical protein CPB86DRAFT_500177 [Serendipita vermifera]|nr:hypothetical protein CPB86DRAFT_500177 [Serendipita vermifera]